MKKNLFKFLGIIALAAIIGFAGCSNDSTDGTGTGDGTGPGGGGVDTRVELTANTPSVSLNYIDTSAYACFIGTAGLTLSPSDFTVTGGLSVYEVEEDEEEAPGTYYVVLSGLTANPTTVARTFTVGINPSSTKIKGSATVVITQAATPSSTAEIDDVTIGGLAVVGQTLTVIAWDEDENIVTDVNQIQWYHYDIDTSAKTAIPGATNQTYTLVASDESKYITVSVKNPATATAVFFYYRVGPIAPAGSTAKSITITDAAAMNGKNAWLYVYDPDDLYSQVSCGRTGYPFVNGSVTVPLVAPPDWSNPWYGNGQHYLILEGEYSSEKGAYSYYFYTNGAELTNMDDVALYNITDANHSIPWSKFKGPVFMSDIGWGD